MLTETFQPPQSVHALPFIRFAEVDQYQEREDDDDDDGKRRWWGWAGWRRKDKRRKSASAARDGVRRLSDENPNPRGSNGRSRWLGGGAKGMTGGGVRRMTEGGVREPFEMLQRDLEMSGGLVVTEPAPRPGMDLTGDGTSRAGCRSDSSIAVDDHCCCCCCKIPMGVR